MKHDKLANLLDQVVAELDRLAVEVEQEAKQPEVLNKSIWVPEVGQTYYTIFVDAPEDEMIGPIHFDGTTPVWRLFVLGMLFRTEQAARNTYDAMAADTAIRRHPQRITRFEDLSNEVYGIKVIAGSVYAARITNTPPLGHSVFPSIQIVEDIIRTIGADNIRKLANHCAR